MPSKGVALLAAGLLFVPAAADAQNISEGHRLAARWCSTCHAVEGVVRGPVRDAAPSFVSIARMRSTTEMSLTVFLMTPHPSMPNFSLSRKEIRDVVAYILDLKRDETRPIKMQISAPARRSRHD